MPSAPAPVVTVVAFPLLDIKVTAPADVEVIVSAVVLALVRVKPVGPVSNNVFAFDVNVVRVFADPTEFRVMDSIALSTVTTPPATLETVMVLASAVPVTEESTKSKVAPAEEFANVMLVTLEAMLFTVNNAVDPVLDTEVTPLAAKRSSVAPPAAAVVTLTVSTAVRLGVTSPVRVMLIVSIPAPPLTESRAWRV
jgi:hypothetical protein